MTNSSRGYTDLLTGSTKLSDIPVSSLTRYVLKGRLPLSFLPSFLHEVTHFWCMASDLGHTLAMLEMRAHHQIVSEERDSDLLSHDLGAMKIARQILHPLLEGMALFQEFDAFPGDSRVFSNVVKWAAVLFRPLEEKEPQSTNSVELLERMLIEHQTRVFKYRTSKEALDRKINVLMRSISNDPHYYLAGYLSVKQIWLTAACNNTPAFRDRDLFLLFLRDWIFQDWKLIGYLLDPDLDSYTLASLVLERIQVRLHQLITTNLTEQVTVYERETDSKQPDAARLLWSLHISEEEAQQGIERYWLLYNEIIVGLDSAKHENLYLLDACTLEHRQEMIRLAMEPVEIEVNEHDRVLIRKKTSTENTSGSMEERMDTYLAAPAPEGAERGITPGWMVMYFLPKYLAVVVLAVHENQSMMLLPPSANIPNDYLEILRGVVTLVVKTEIMRNEFTKFGVDELNDPIYDLTLEDFPVREVYTNYALNSVPENKLAEVEAMLSKKGGLYHDVFRNRDLLNAFVKLSLATLSITPSLDSSHKEFLSGMIADDGFTIDSVLSQTYQRQKETGMALLLRENDVEWFFMI
jgi:hypothetical protein